MTPHAIRDPAVDALLAPGPGRTTRRNFADIEGPPERITPLYDWLLVRRIRPESPVERPGLTVTKGGLWVDQPDTGPRRGIVVQIGRGERPKKGATFDGWARHQMDVKVGDTIIYPRFESTHVMIDGQQYTFVREGDVMAVLEE